MTGAQGFLGRHLVARWLESRPDVEVLGLGRSDRLNDTFTFELGWKGRTVPAPLPSALRGLAADARYDYEQVDACDTERIGAMLRGFRPTVIVHGASALRDDPWQALFHSNVQSVISLMEAVVALGDPLPRLVLVSSGSVYGAKQPDALPLEETDPCVPLDLYAVSKLAGEDAARIAALEHDVPLVRSRIFNLLGPGLQDRHFAAMLAGHVASVRLGIAPAVLEVGRLDTTRDFIDVRDASAALMTLAERATPGERALYNVASGRETPIRVVYEHLVRLGGVSGLVAKEGDPRPLDVPRSYADIGRMRALGFRPAIDLADSLLDMIRYYEESMGAGG